MQSIFNGEVDIHKKVKSVTPTNSQKQVATYVHYVDQFPLSYSNFSTNNPCHDCNYREDSS